MKRIVTAKFVAGVFALGLMAGGLMSVEATAAERGSRVVEDGPQLSEHPKSKVYRRQGPQVRGYVQRRGGYSYSYNDGAIDYRDTSILRDVQNSRRQGGPFDSGFFYDSGINNKLNDSPYLN